jgi:prevent-host-death family protein
MTTVGVSEAKAQLARLLDRVSLGESVTITKRGVPVAMLVPPGQASVVHDDVLRELDEIAEGVNLGGLTIRQSIDDGRP